MKLECASSCTTQGAPPQDKSDKCKKWTELGECTRNADFMSVECATSCKDRFSLPDKNAMCEQWVATGECLRNTAFMELGCAASCHNHTLSERGRADNRTEDCIYWAARGECEKNADFMRSEKSDCLPFCKAAAKAAAERDGGGEEAGKRMARAAAVNHRRGLTVSPEGERGLPLLAPSRNGGRLRPFRSPAPPASASSSAPPTLVAAHTSCSFTPCRSR